MALPSTMFHGMPADQFHRAIAEYLRDRFSFLRRTYQCVQVPPREPAEVRYANARTLVIIRSDYEGPYVGFDCVDWPSNHMYGCISLRTLMILRESVELRRFGDGPCIDYFEIYADALPVCATDIMAGDFTIQNAVDQYHDERQKRFVEWNANLDRQHREARAAEAFRRADFAKVVDILTPHEAELSRAQFMKLSIARRKCAAVS